MRWWRVVAASAAVIAIGCGGTPEADPRYRPAENVLEVVAVLHHHVADDTYRFEPARDYTGRNIYRASLIRLENMEKAYEPALRSGYMDDVIAFAKARALERLRAFHLAAAHYRLASERGEELELESLRSAAICEALAEAFELELESRGDLLPPDLSADEASAPPVAAGETIASAAQEPAEPPDVDTALSLLERRRALLEALARGVTGSHYEPVLREELEATDQSRAELLVNARELRPNGDLEAVAALQQVVMDHRESKNANHGLLDLADFYATLAEEYVEEHPPESLSFDPPTFEEYVNSAARLYEAVSNQDGATERLEAARRLEGFLAFTLRVDRDRFSR